MVKLPSKGGAIYLRGHLPGKVFLNFWISDWRVKKKKKEPQDSWPLYGSQEAPFATPSWPLCSLFLKTEPVQNPVSTHPLATTSKGFRVCSSTSRTVLCWYFQKSAARVSVLSSCTHPAPSPLLWPSSHLLCGLGVSWLPVSSKESFCFPQFF